MPNRRNDWTERWRIQLDEFLSKTLASGESGRSNHASGTGPQVAALESRILYSATPLDPSLIESDQAMAGTESMVQTEPAEPEQIDSSETYSTEANEQTASTLVFVDSTVPDIAQVLDDLAENQPEAQVFVLGSDTDGIEQITSILKGYDEVEDIHIISHSVDAEVVLGNTRLSQQTIAGYAGDIASWGSSLADEADILFYGCDLASSAQGRELIDSIAELTDADVAASLDDTGHQDFQSDWALEYSQGKIDV
ncbi:MAG: DUF4347 domain-containing protein, partial [Planctomycetota bacterium]